MSHTASSLVAAVTADPSRLNAAMSVLGTATATNPEAIALEITSMTDEQRAEALFAAALALGAAARTFRALGIKPGGQR